MEMNLNVFLVANASTFNALKVVPVIKTVLMAVTNAQILFAKIAR